MVCFPDRAGHGSRRHVDQGG